MNASANGSQTATPQSQATQLADEASRFEALVEPYRREIRLHCYRMLGSFDEAEDVEQESFLRAWKSFAEFEDRGYARAWLYRIATNACLNALASRKVKRRWLPSEYTPATTSMPDGKPVTEVGWLQPYPTPHIENIADDSPDQLARYTAKESVRLAFIAAIQHLPPRQRAVLLVCDVLGWSAMEAATLFGGSVASINSALQRARETLTKKKQLTGSSGVRRLASGDQNRLLLRYVEAWQNLDLGNFVSLLKEDATYSMPPLSQWYDGIHDIQRFFDWAWKGYDSYRLIPISANGESAFAAYSRTKADGPWSAHSVHILELDGDIISSITLFLRSGSSSLFEAFDLPEILSIAADDGQKITR